MTGIGYRKDFAAFFPDKGILRPDFIEVAPENWIEVGGYWKRKLDEVLEEYPLFTHGLSLSLGSPDEIDMSFLKKVKTFLNETGALLYSEHLSYSKCDNAHLYDLLPIPFTEDAVKHVAKRIRQAQNFLERKIAIEIVSYYSPLMPEMTEIDFVKSVLTEADCDLLLDVNNVYVNAFNHGYNAEKFIAQLPPERVRYIHMAGHTQVSPNLIIDSHGEAIIDPVYKLFAYTLRQLKQEVPVLLERDFNIPEMAELQKEIDQLESIQSKIGKEAHHAVK
jgi:uncharacterized protein (UPF0276 family)